MQVGVLAYLFVFVLICKAIDPSLVEHEYIVKYKGYHEVPRHQKILNEILSFSRVSWSVVHRNNPAQFIPSDFSVIRINNVSQSEENELISTLDTSDFVKYVTPHRRYLGHLNEWEEPENATGRITTKFSFDTFIEPTSWVSRKLLSPSQVTDVLHAPLLWEKGFKGQGVRVAVFDTGLRKNHPHFRNLKEISNWTTEESEEDGIGHGTFVAGVIASGAECLGFAPESDLFIFRVFTNNRVSYTSWFLDAFNYAIHKKINILNLSIGGPDFMDRPFVEKVWELSANNIIVVSAIGNDGPLYGTLNNPADQLDVIGVGAIDMQDRLAGFSSRGMTTWEIPEGYGRVKPDIVSYGQSVSGSKVYGGCRTLSGTSVASPVVAGAIALLASTVPEVFKVQLKTTNVEDTFKEVTLRRWDILNPASIKQIILAGAQPLHPYNIFEQGAGKLDLMRSYEHITKLVPHVSALPSKLDLTSCPYMWPYCSQPLYYGGMPVSVNVTLLNGMGVAGDIDSEPIFRPTKNGEMIQVKLIPSVESQDKTKAGSLWPWSGWLGVVIQVSESAKNFQGIVEGFIEISVTSRAISQEVTSEDAVLFHKDTITIPLRLQLIPTPPRDKRILWDMFHNLRYPSGYFPRDALDQKEEPFDWNADHPHTNFKSLFNQLISMGYFIEVLGAPLTCFDASQYGTLLIIDSEDEFFPLEIKKLKKDVEEFGLNVVIIGDWYHPDVMKQLKFFDENTQTWWMPVTGGSNVPALNKLLSTFQMELGNKVFNGEFETLEDGFKSHFSSGNSIVKFPKGGTLVSFTLNDQTAEIVSGDADVSATVPVLGFYQVPKIQVENSTEIQVEEPGKVVLFGDSSCMDDASKKTHCLWLFQIFLDYFQGKLHEIPFEKVTILENDDYVSKSIQAPPVSTEYGDLVKFSRVISHSLSCKRIDFSKNLPPTTEEIIDIQWENFKPSSNLGRFKEKIFFRNESNTNNNTSLQTGFIPYVIGFIVIVFVLIVAVRRRPRNSSWSPNVSRITTV